MDVCCIGDGHVILAVAPGFDPPRPRPRTVPLSRHSTTVDGPQLPERRAVARLYECCYFDDRGSCGLGLNHPGFEIDR